MEERINSAVEKHLGLWWTDNTSREITKEYGSAVANNVREIYKFAISFDVKWVVVDFKMEPALILLEIEIRKRYPYLSDRAVDKLKLCFAWVNR